jgi:16S rRNA (guanine527-N7)-methyltransferase
VSEYRARLAAGAARLGVAVDESQLVRLQQLAQELLRWNRAYNLTAITDLDEVLTHHLLDSLAAHTDLAGVTVADVGTGAGFPGLPLAIVDPERQFTLIDAVDKKLRFIDHMARELRLANVRTHHGRVEQLKPDRHYDTVIARAFAPLPRLAGWIEPLCTPATRVVAMKGRWPPPANDKDGDGGPLPAGWRIESVRPVAVPGLAEARHHLLLRRAGPPA